MCMLFVYNPQIIFVNYRLNKLNLSFFRGYNIQSDYIVGTMCSQLLLQFYGDSLKHYSDYFCNIFHKLNLVIFQALLLLNSGHLVCATPPTIFQPVTFETLQVLS